MEQLYTCPEMSTSFTGGSPARISALQAAESAWTESEAVFIGKSTGSLKKQSLALYFSKTYQQLELGGLTLSFSHLPSFGMTAGGLLCQPPKLAPRTCEKDGFSWRTPQARDGIPRGPQSPEKRKAGGHSVGLGDQVGGQLNPMWVEWLMGYPTEWTALEDWGTAWFRPKRVKRSCD